MFNQLNDVQRGRLFNAVLTVVILLGVYLAAASVNAFKSNEYIGRGEYPANSITVSGTGDAYAVPDTSTISFSVTEEAKTASAAQDALNKKANAIIAAVKDLGIDSKDIQTNYYNSYPKYEYSSAVCPEPQPMIYSGSSVSGQAIKGTAPYYCPPGKQTLTGYEATETVTIKVRKTQDAGAVLSKVGELGATNVSGPNFSIDDMDSIQAEARDKAIANAKEKANVLAKSLGVKLGKVVNFQEPGQPIYYAMDKAMGAGVSSPAPTMPDFETGQNKVTSNVTITYEVD